MAGLLIFLVFGLLGFFMALLLFSVINMLLTWGTPVEPCKSHKWRHEEDGQTLRCEVCKKTFNEVLGL